MDFKALKTTTLLCFIGFILIFIIWTSFDFFYQEFFSYISISFQIKFKMISFYIISILIQVFFLKKYVNDRNVKEYLFGFIFILILQILFYFI